MKQPTKTLGIVLLALGAALAIAVSTVAGPCVHDDGTAAACAASGQLIVVLGVVAAVAGSLRAFVPNAKAALAASIVAVVMGLLIAVLPGNATPLCMMSTMHCQAVMHPVAIIFGLAICVVGIVDAALMLRSSKKKR